MLKAAVRADAKHLAAIPSRYDLAARNRRLSRRTASIRRRSTPPMAKDY